jgi:hypothetical protein
MASIFHQQEGSTQEMLLSRFYRLLAPFAGRSTPAWRRCQTRFAPALTSTRCQLQHMHASAL